MCIQLKNNKYLFSILLISTILLLVACGGGEKNDIDAPKNSKTVNGIEIGGKTIFLPEEFIVPTITVSGDFNGQVINAGDNGEVAGFVSGRPAFDGESNAANFLSSVEIDIAGFGALTNISKSQPRNNTVIAQYQMTLQTAAAANDLSNLVLEAIAVSTRGGVVDDLPTAPNNAELDTVFRLSITIKYFSQTDVFIMVSVTSDGNYPAFSSILLALGDGTNVGYKGDILAADSDSFVASDAASMSDFLFVVDNSGSMSSEQNAVSQAADDFFSAISSTQTDFRIGVITTDSMNIRGADFTDDLATFKTNILAGTGGSATETGIWYAEQSLLSIEKGDLVDGTVTALGVPRIITDSNSASLSVIILSDEKSQYTRRSGGVMFDPINNLFLARDYKVYAIIDSSQDGTSQYDDLAIASGGSTASINDLTVFPAIMELIAANATGAASRYVLSKTPVSGSLVVKVDGVEINNANIDGWQYRSSSNSIVFFGNEIPAGGATVEVFYDRIQKQTVGADITIASVIGEVTLTWDAVENASGYKVYWSTSADVSPSSSDGAFTTTDLFYEHTGLTSGVTYYYVVTAIINGRESTPSIELSEIPNPVAVYDFDNGTLQGWTTNGAWAVTTESAFSGTYSVTDSVGGDYANNSQTALISPVLNLSLSTSPRLSFKYRLFTEDTYDFGLLNISTDGGVTFKTQMRFGVSTSSFTTVEFDLTPYISDQVVIQFQLDTDDTEQRDGWYLDDITINYE